MTDTTKPTNVITLATAAIDPAVNRAFEAAMDIYQPEWRSLWNSTTLRNHREMFFIGMMATQAAQVQAHEESREIQWLLPTAQPQELSPLSLQFALTLPVVQVEGRTELDISLHEGVSAGKFQFQQVQPHESNPDLAVVIGVFTAIDEDHLAQVKALLAPPVPAEATAEVIEEATGDAAGDDFQNDGQVPSNG